MQKDVIYIDTEDDITAIIGKVKGADAKIVALVPPKRIGAIQSAVNLKLVHRAAAQADKHLVIISNNAALMALAASASIPVAKNLQSKPELAEIPALELDEGEDVIDGEAPEPDSDDAGDDVVADIEGAEKTAVAPKVTKKALGATAVAKGKVKIPNFNKFRKKLFLIIAAAVLLVGGLVWALVFAPRANIIITARTSDIALNSQVQLTESAKTSLKDGVIKSVAKTSQKAVSISFTATGKKDVGEKATGTVRFKTNTISSLGTIEAGTTLTSTSGKTYTTDSAVTLTIANAMTGVTAAVTATSNGASFNAASGAVTGAPSGVTANFVGSTSGGTDKTVSVVQQSDIDEISDQVVTSAESDAAKKALIEQLGSNYIVLDNSFKVDKTAVTSSPAVDAEAADGKGTLAGNVTFSIVAVAKTELSTFLKAYFNQSIDGKSNQKVYDDGASSVSFTNVNSVDGGYTANIATNGKVGPKIDEDSLKKYAAGKKSGEVQDYARNISGVEDVEIKLSPFWVTAVPGDTAKISVEFKVNE